MKSFSTIDPDSIRKHLANNSPTKIAHQFSKTKRFPDINPQCPLAFYTYDSQLSKRKTSFGYGNKIDLTRPTTVSPPSTKYNHKSFVEQTKNKGLSFGLSRQSSPDKSYLIPQLQKIPGPGKYENQIQTKMNQSYTIRPRTLDVIDKHNTSKQTPGPGKYQSIDLEPKTGRFFYANYSDIKYAKINANGERFQKIKQSPGPSQYFQKDSLSSNAKYLLSNHKGNGTRPFSQTMRFTKQKWTSLTNPGPGQYEKPSQFGSYGDAKYYKTLTSFKA